MTINNCHCGSGEERRELTDARGISCGFVCDSCEAEKRAKYRPEIFNDPNYWADEQIEPDEDVLPYYPEHDDFGASADVNRILKNRPNRRVR